MLSPQDLPVIALPPAFLVLSATLILGCDGTTAGSGGHTSTGSGGHGGSCPDGISPSSTHAAPPAPAPGAPPPDGSGHVTFAINGLFTGWNGKVDSANDWLHRGFDLDGRISGTCTSDGFAGLCIPREHWPREEAQVDGNQGIDNSFGRNVLVILEGGAPFKNFGTQIPSFLGDGGPTVLIDIDALGGGADYAGVTARLYAGAPLGMKPMYDGTDAWPVRPESLANPSELSSPLLQTSDTYVTGNIWVGRFHGDLTLELPWLSPADLHLRITNPIVSMPLDAAHTSATNGTLAGVISTSALNVEVMLALGWLEPNGWSCPGLPANKDWVEVVDRASDIMLDGTQDPTAECDGISIGLGFDAKQVTIGSIAAPEMRPEPPCAPLDGG